MLLVSITEKGREQKIYSTVENLPQLYRGLCSGLDVQKFINLSNYDLFFCSLKFDLQTLKEEEFTHADLYDPVIDNLADSVYQFMRENVDVYYDILKKIDEYRQQVNNYIVDK